MRSKYMPQPTGSKLRIICNHMDLARPTSGPTFFLKRKSGPTDLLDPETKKAA